MSKTTTVLKLLFTLKTAIARGLKPCLVGAECPGETARALVPEEAQVPTSTRAKWGLTPPLQQQYTVILR